MDARSRSLRKYGLTQGDYDEMVATQNGQCMICKTDKPGTVGVLACRPRSRHRAGPGAALQRLQRWPRTIC